MIQPSGGKSWICRVQKNGNRHDFGLSSASKVSLETARERSREIRAWVELGLDPIFERSKAPAGGSRGDRRPQQEMANEKHEKQWSQTLETYMFPQIDHVQVHEITWPMIRNALSDSREFDKSAAC